MSSFVRLLCGVAVLSWRSLASQYTDKVSIFSCNACRRYTRNYHVYVQTCKDNFNVYSNSLGVCDAARWNVGCRMRP